MSLMRPILSAQMAEFFGLRVAEGWTPYGYIWALNGFGNTGLILTLLLIVLLGIV